MIVKADNGKEEIPDSGRIMYLCFDPLQAITLLNEARLTVLGFQQMRP